MIINLVETSKVVSLLKFIWERYSHIDGCLDNYYKYSQIYHLINKVSAQIGNLFKDSFLERVSRIRQGENAQTLTNSRVVRYWMNWLMTKKKLILECANTSRIVISAKETVKTAYRAPIKTLGIIIILAILVNIFLSFFLKREIALFGWVVRGIFLFIGVSGIFCTVDWSKLEDNSMFLKKMIKKK